MTKLNDRPVRPRQRADRPSYPRTISLGAVALVTAMAATTVGCANVVETAEADDGKDDSSWLDSTWIFDQDNWEEPDGDYAGGIGDEWVEEGGGGAGGDGAGGDGAGGDGAGGDGAGGDGAGGDWAS